MSCVGSNHLLQSCLSLFVYLYGQPQPFGSCIILQSCSSSISTANLSCLLATTFTSHSFLSNSFSSPRFNLLRVARCCFRGLLFLTTFSFHLVVVVFSFLLCLFGVLSCLSLLCFSVSEALFALSFSFLSEHLLFFLASFSSMLKLLWCTVEMNNTGVTGQF